MKDLAELISSFQNYSAKVKQAIKDGDLIAIAEIERLMEELTTQIDNENVEMGLSGGGDMGVAITERFHDLGSTSVINCGIGNHFGKTITAATTFNVLNVPLVGRVCSFTLRLIDGGSFPVTFWDDIYWSEGHRPELSPSGKDVIAFTTVDGGLTWEGYLIGKSLSLPT